jgi:hypothetical protein
MLAEPHGAPEWNFAASGSTTGRLNRTSWHLHCKHAGIFRGGWVEFLFEKRRFGKKFGLHAPSRAEVRTKQQKKSIPYEKDNCHQHDPHLGVLPYSAVSNLGLHDVALSRRPREPPGPTPPNLRPTPRPASPTPRATPPVLTPPLLSADQAFAASFAARTVHAATPRSCGGHR